MDGVTVRAIVLALTLTVIPTVAPAQTRSTRDTATAYGARLASPDRRTDLNQRRVNNRIDSRIDNRLSLRLERYRPDTAADPAAAFRAVPDDGARRTPVIAPPPPREPDALR